MSNVVDLTSTHAFNKKREEKERATNNKLVVKKEKLTSNVSALPKVAEVIALPGVSLKRRGSEIMLGMLEKANITREQNTRIITRMAMYPAIQQSWNTYFHYGLPENIVAKINSLIMIELMTATIKV